MATAFLTSPPPPVARRPLTEDDAVNIWIARWLRVRQKDLVKRYACDPRRLSEVWEESRIPGSRKKALELFAPIPTRKAAAAEETDFTDIAALVVTVEDESIIHDRRVKAFHIPLFLIVHGHEERTDNTLGHVYGMIDVC